MSCTNVRCLFSAAQFESQVVSRGQFVETMVFRKRSRFEMTEILRFDYLTCAVYCMFDAIHSSYLMKLYPPLRT